MAKRFGGTWPAMLTPLGRDGRPNLDACEYLVDLFARQGLDGIYVAGSTGQWPLLTIDERMAIAERVVAAAAGRLPVMVHVGAVSTADSIALAKHAAKIGADAVSAVAPIYYSYSADAVMEHLQQIASASDLPFFAYHLSSASRTVIDPRVFAERLLTFPNIAGMKITDQDLYPFGLIRGIVGDRLQLFSGADEVMCQAVLSGAIGAIGTFYNLWGPECQAARKATVTGGIQTGLAFMLRFESAIADVFANGGMWTFLRAAMRLKHGIDVGMPRPPLAATDRQWRDDEVARILDRMR